MQLALPGVPRGSRAALVVVSYLLTGCWLAVNARRRLPPLRYGLLLLAAGWFLNLLPVALNGSMPVSEVAVRRVAHHRDAGSPANISKHAPVGDDTRVAWLGDVIPVVALRSVVSGGDLLLAAGLTTTVAAAMTGRARPR